MKLSIRRFRTRLGGAQNARASMDFAIRAFADADAVPPPGTRRGLAAARLFARYAGERESALGALDLTRSSVR
jgi:hypothetical protein